MGGEVAGQALGEACSPVASLGLCPLFLLVNTHAHRNSPQPQEGQVFVCCSGRPRLALSLPALGAEARSGMVRDPFSLSFAASPGTPA